MLSVSITMPRPAKAASPCMTSGRQPKPRCSSWVRARHAAHHRIDALQVRRIGRKEDRDIAVLRLSYRTGAEVIRQIALHGRGLRIGIETIDQLRRIEVHHVGKHIQAPAMRHAREHLPNAMSGSLIDDCFNERHEALATFEREALCMFESRRHMTLPRFSGHEAAQQTAARLARSGNGASCSVLSHADNWARRC